MAGSIYVDPSVTASVIKVGGVCYERVGPSLVAAGSYTIQGQYGSCTACSSSGYSSSSSSSGSSVGSCCGGVNLSYTVMVNSPYTLIIDQSGGACTTETSGSGTLTYVTPNVACCNGTASGCQWGDSRICLTLGSNSCIYLCDNGVEYTIATINVSAAACPTGTWSITYGGTTIGSITVSE
ncbi:MAG: hypothetical protein M0Z50_18200 [Planctomycetia bacterium]|nr:hypothetical protein [Planctomycetia bacterium]